MIYFWLRNDLRLWDNQALEFAYQLAKKESLDLQYVWIWDTNILKNFSKENKKIIYLSKLLNKLSKIIEESGSKLNIYEGQPDNIFGSFISNTDKIVASMDFTPYATKRDKLIAKKYDAVFIRSSTIIDYENFNNNEGGVIQRFSVFKKKYYEKLLTHQFNDYLFLDKINIFQQSSNEIKKDISYFFEEKIDSYPILRDYPNSDNTSKLSIPLKFGEVSIIYILEDLLKLKSEKKWKFIDEIIWREFSTYLIYRIPSLSNKSYIEKYSKWKLEYKDINWREDTPILVNKVKLAEFTNFLNWCEGKTGFKFVDAGMSELNETGYMHNRLRMICASFLTKNLQIDWRIGERYFAIKLLDYFKPSNNFGWQWVAGTGVDAMPYFRVFNPELQAEKFDKDNLYIQKWTNVENPKMIDFKSTRDSYLRLFR